MADVLVRVNESIPLSKSVIRSIDAAKRDTAVTPMTRTTIEEQLEHLLASALAQTTNYLILLTLLPLLAKVQPVIVAKEAQNMSHLEGLMYTD